MIEGCRVPLFQGLTGEQLAEIAGRVTSERWDAGQIVFSEWERGGDLLILQEGSVRVVKTAASGRQQLISIEREGSSLGEVSVFDGGCYSATEVAISAIVVLRLKGEHFRAFCMAHPDVAFEVIRVLGHRLRGLRNLVEQLSFATVRDRLIAHLLQLAGPDGGAVGDGAGVGVEEPGATAWGGSDSDAAAGSYDSGCGGAAS